MIGLLVADVTVGVCGAVVIHRLALVVAHGGVEGALNAPVTVHGLFDGLIVLGRQNLDVLHVKAGL